MAKKVPLSVSLLDMDVTVTTSIDGEDGDSAIKTVCVGGPDMGTDPHDPVRTSQVMRCPTCKVEKSSHWGFPVRAHEADDGSLTPLTAEQLASAKPGEEITGRIALTSYPTEQVEAATVPYGKFYYLVPQRTGLSKYAAVREGLRQEIADGWSFLTEYAPSTAASTYRVLISEDLICLQELARAERVKVRPAIAVPEHRDADVAMFRAMAATVRGTFDVSTFPDQRKAAISAAIASGTSMAPSTAIASAPTEVLSDFERAFRALQKQGTIPADEPAKPARKPRARRKAADKVPA